MNKNKKIILLVIIGFCLFVMGMGVGSQIGKPTCDLPTTNIPVTEFKPIDCMVENNACEVIANDCKSRGGYPGFKWDGKYKYSCTKRIDI